MLRRNTADDVWSDCGEYERALRSCRRWISCQLWRDKIQEIGDKALDAYTDTENAVTKVNAYFGETGAGGGAVR